MLAFEIAEAFTFNEAKIITFFKIIDKIFATHDIIKDQKKKQWILNYLLLLVTWNLKQVNYYQQLFYLNFYLATCKEYQD